MNDIVRAILTKNEHAVLATVTPDGAPKAVPVHIAFDDTTVYWVSNAQTNHSLNITHDSRVSIVAFDSHQTGSEPGEKGAVYISTKANELGGEKETVARKVYYERYPHRNIEKYNEWSIYGASLGIVDQVKSRDAMIYMVDDEEIA